MTIKQLSILRSKFSNFRTFLSIGKVRINSRMYSGQRIGYIGGQGHRNLGDDAIYLAAGQLLSKHNLLPYDYPSREKNLQKIGLGGKMFFKEVILGGGTLIDPIGVDNWMAKAIDAIEQNIPIWAWGTGVGNVGAGQKNFFPEPPIPPTMVLPERWRELLLKFKGIGVRGPRSQKALQEIGIHNVRVVGDLALGLACDRVVQPTAHPKIAVNLAVPHGRSLEEYPVLMKISEFLIQLVHNGWEIVPIAMDWTDKYPLQELLKRIPEYGFQLLRPQTVNEFFNSVAPCKFTVAVRLHASVLSCCVGVPSLAVVYRDKVLDFMETMQLEKQSIGLYEQDLEKITGRFDELVSLPLSHREQTLAQAQHWKKVLQNYAVEMAS